MKKPVLSCEWLEMLALSAGILIVFIIVYFGAWYLPHRTPIIVPWDPVWSVPYVGAFVVPYVSTYFVPGLLLLAPCSRADFRRFVATFAAAILLSGPWFLLMPLVPPRAALGDGILDHVLLLIYRLDVNGNCFPSLHVSLAFLTALAVGRCLPWARPLMLLWATSVALSTVFVHQHYVIDAIGGTVLAFSIWSVAFRRPASL